MGRTIIHGQGDEPDIFLFDEVTELQKELGYPRVEGLYEAQKNVIYATRESLAHEIAHYKDLKSGRYIDWQSLSRTQDRQTAQIRNELVAILYAWKKSGKTRDFKDFEKEVIEFFYFQIEQSRIGPHFENLDEVSFSQIQDIAEEFAQPDFPGRDRLKQLLEHYIQLSESVMKYSRQSIA